MLRIAKNLNIDFMGRRKVAFVISALLITIAIAALAIRGLNFGLDFTGGTLIEVEYPQSVALADVRNALADSGIEDAIVQTYGSTRDLVVRVPPIDGQDNDELSQQVLAALDLGDGLVPEMRRIDFVGPQVGEELAQDGGLALLFALIGILLYIIARFEWRFALGAVAALIHDVTITTGMFALLQLDFDLTVIAALLAVIGYSLNDTIVVFDRIRENFRTMRKATPLETMNAAINQTLSRTLMTSLTTLMVLLALYVFGGESVAVFALALIIGVFVGTYSSIFVAAATALALKVSKQDLMPAERDEALDAMP